MFVLRSRTKPRRCRCSHARGGAMWSTPFGAHDDAVLCLEVIAAISIVSLPHMCRSACALSLANKDPIRLAGGHKHRRRHKSQNQPSAKQQEPCAFLSACPRSIICPTFNQIIFPSWRRAFVWKSTFLFCNPIRSLHEILLY